MKKTLFLFILIALFLISCGPTLKKVQISDPAVQAEREKQKALYFENYTKQQIRLYNISAPIVTAAAELAPQDKVVNSFGFFAVYRDKFPQEYRDIAIRQYQLTELPQVIAVIQNGPAKRAGLKEGDKILVVNGVSVGKDIFEVLQKERNKKSMMLTVQREGQKQYINIDSLPAYNCPVVLRPDPQINAFADGKNVHICMGLMNSLNDDEVGVVVGHELSHNILDHIGKTRGNAALGTVADILVSGLLSAATRTSVSTRGAFTKMGAGVYSKEFEFEADYMGLYLAARANLDIGNAANLWRKMAVTSPGSINEKSYFASHPSSPERFLTMDKTIEEIKAKKASGTPLVPDNK